MVTLFVYIEPKHVCVPRRHLYLLNFTTDSTQMECDNEHKASTVNSVSIENVVATDSGIAKEQNIECGAMEQANKSEIDTAPGAALEGVKLCGAGEIEMAEFADDCLDRSSTTTSCTEKNTEEVQQLSDLSDTKTDKVIEKMNENVVSNDTIKINDSEHSTMDIESSVDRLLESQKSIDSEACNQVASHEIKSAESAVQSNHLNVSQENAKLDTKEAKAVVGELHEVSTLLQSDDKDDTRTNKSLNVISDKIVAEANNESQQTTLESIRSDSLKASDNKTLTENISSKTIELLDSMETENTQSTSATPNEIHIKKEKTSPTTSSLSLLAQYASDSEAGDADCEDEDIMEVPLEASKDYRNKIVEIKSESESESSSSDDSDVEYLTTIRKEIQKTIDFDDEEDDDEEGDEAGSGKRKKKQAPMRVKGEMLLEDLPPIQDLHITVPEEECVELGQVHSIIDQLLLVSVKQDSLLLDLDTVLFLDKGKKVLGEVFDVLGQVADPMYCVRFNSHKEIEEKGIQVGDKVYVAPKTQYTQFVILSSLMKLRGSDASWENDVEPPPRYLDYSDDEQEREARTRLRNKDRPNDHQDAVKRSRGNNDDDDDETASTSTVASSSQSAYAQRSGRFNRERVGPVRPPYHYQRNQAQPNAPNSGSWHSNYRQPYSAYYNASSMPHHQVLNSMPSPYPVYSAGPYAPPTMSPIQSPAPPPMYVLNPLAVVPPGMYNNRPQYHAPQQTRRHGRHSPPPAPPGLD